MVEVITPGPKTFTVTCSKCRTQFKYALVDLAKDYTRGGREYVACPSCGCAHDHRLEAWSRG